MIMHAVRLSVLHALALLVSPALAGPARRLQAGHSGQYAITFTGNATNLRHHLFHTYDEQFVHSYDKHVPPPDANRGAAHSEAGTDVSVQLRVFKLEEVNVNMGFMKVKVWVRMSWRDDRLRWNPKDFGGVTSVWATTSPDETAEVWVPGALMPHAARPPPPHTRLWLIRADASIKKLAALTFAALTLAPHARGPHARASPSPLSRSRHSRSRLTLAALTIAPHTRALSRRHRRYHVHEFACATHRCARGD